MEEEQNTKKGGKSNDKNKEDDRTYYDREKDPEHLRTWEDKALYVHMKSTQAQFVKHEDLAERVAAKINAVYADAYAQIKKIKADEPELKDAQIQIRVWQTNNGNRRLDQMPF